MPVQVHLGERFEIHGLSIACGATERTLMLLEGKKLLVTGVLTRESIAYAAARPCRSRGPRSS